MSKSNGPPADTHFSGKKILDVGCGRNKHSGAIGMDYNPDTDADVIHDLGEFPYPFSDDEFEEVIGNHVIEHVPNVTAFISEIYRVTKPGGRIQLLAPHYTNPDWACDVTHRNHFNCYSFQNFIPDRQLFPFYTEVQLEPLGVHVSLANLWRFLGIEFLVNLDQRWPVFSLYQEVLGALSELLFSR